MSRVGAGVRAYVVWPLVLASHWHDHSLRIYWRSSFLAADFRYLEKSGIGAIAMSPLLSCFAATIRGALVGVDCVVDLAP